MTKIQQVPTGAPPDGRAGLYLTFALAKEIYGLEILTVQEIIQMAPITAMPRTPDSVRGVINLRGKVIPVIDLRETFGMESVEDTNQTCIVVVQVSVNEQAITTGVVVDQVAEVLDVAPDQLEPPPELGASVDTGFILGMGKVDEKVIMLLDIRRVLGGDEWAEIGKMAENDA